jgi:hypothetical protein
MPYFALVFVIRAVLRTAIYAPIALAPPVEAAGRFVLHAVKGVVSVAKGAMAVEATVVINTCAPRSFASF